MESEQIISAVSLPEIHGCFSEFAWARGARDAASGFVTADPAEWADGRSGRAWKGERGFAGVKEGRDGRWRLIGGCLCVDKFCAHVAGIMWQAFRNSPNWVDDFKWVGRQRLGYYGDYQQPQISPEARLESWLMAPASAPSEAETESKLVVVLAGRETHAAGTRRVHMYSAVTKAIKGPDRFAKLRYLEKGKSEIVCRHEFMSDDLYRLFFAWGKGNLDERGYGWSNRLDDEVGMLVLRSAIGQQRLVCENSDGRPTAPVTWGPARKLEWDWLLHEESRLWTIECRVADGGLPYFGRSPLYIDHDGLTIGELDLVGMDVRAAERASGPGTPPIPDSWIKSNSRKPVALRALPKVPAHVVPAADVVISGVKPVPIVRVDFTASGTDAEFDLSFRYGDERGFWGDDSQSIAFIKRDEKHIEVHRDVHEERRHIDTLSACGIGAGNGRRWSLTGSDAERHDAFAKLLATDFEPLRSAGFEIEKLSGWTDRVREVESVDLGWNGIGDDGSAAAVLDFSIGFILNGKRVNLLPMLPELIAKIKVVANRPAAVEANGTDRVWVRDATGTWLGLPKGQLAPWIAALADLVGDRSAKDLKGKSLRVSTIEALRVEASLHADIVGTRGLKILRELMTAKECEDAIFIPGFIGELRTYQRSAYHWLEVIAKYHLGGVLGDDMGLGKTVETICHLMSQKAAGVMKLPALIVAPANVLSQWRDAIAEFAPSMKVVALRGSGRDKYFEDFGAHADVVLTTFKLLNNDVDALKSQRWHAVVLDEAQNIRNHRNQAAVAVRELDANYKLALTGTPLENKLLDTWSIFDAVLPGYLSIQTRFAELFGKPIEREGDAGKHQLLLRRLAPFLLRRTKKQVAVELPPKIESVVGVEMSAEQANLYETVRLSTVKSVREAFEKQGVHVSPSFVLEKLTRLRQVCCEPGLTEIGRKQRVMGSAKLAWLFEELPRMLEDGRKVLLFTTFTSFFSYIEVHLFERGIKYAKLYSSATTNNDSEIARFRSGDADVFMIGLKSGGVGLNLVEADTVIHLDPWWNPKAEDQATDRVHRIGQSKTVSSMKLICAGTIEERIVQIQNRKRRLFDSVVDGAALVKAEQMSEAEVMWLLKPLGEVEALEDVLPTTAADGLSADAGSRTGGQQQRA